MFFLFFDVAMLGAPWVCLCWLCSKRHAGCVDYWARPAWQDCDFSPQLFSFESENSPRSPAQDRLEKSCPLCNEQQAGHEYHSGPYPAGCDKLSGRIRWKLYMTACLFHLDLLNLSCHAGHCRSATIHGLAASCTSKRAALGHREGLLVAEG